MPIHHISVRSFLGLVNTEGVNQLQIPGTAARRLHEHEIAQRYQQVELCSSERQRRCLQPSLRAEIVSWIKVAS